LNPSGSILTANRMFHFWRQKEIWPYTCGFTQGGYMKNRRFFIPAYALIFSILAIGRSGSAFEEGMFPISELSKLDLKSKGLKIAPEEIFGSNRDSLIYAIVSVGATGSFVSPDGLFVTNHHVAFGAVQAASSTEKDYLTHGFLAGTRAEEIKAPGMRARITESFRDVSAEVLGALKPEMTLAERTRAIDKRTKEIVAEAEKQAPGKRAEVSEMFIGRTYVLFMYTYLKDIRIVYVPPLSIGNFGGETDNWTWPRHTGDFSFLRAYVAPDGSPADYSSGNVPFKPRRYLKIDPAGVAEGDFVFLMGYPGRTYRHYTASYMAYEEDFRMPYVADWYDWQIGLMERMGTGNPAVSLMLAARIKGLANTMKNYRGKLKGMKKLSLVEAKRAEEKALQKYIEADPERKKHYGDVLPGIDRVYETGRGSAEMEMILEYLRSSVNMFQFGWTVQEAAAELRKPDLERESSYMERNWPQTVQRLQLSMKNYYEPVDKAIFKELLRRAVNLKGSRINALDDFLKGAVSDQALDEVINNTYKNSRLKDEQFLNDALKMSPEQVQALRDPFVELAQALAPDYKELKDAQNSRKGALDTFMARLVEIKEKYQGRNFIPDANSTLRMTYGHIKGYSPADAVMYAPFTTLSGVVEKTAREAPFNTPGDLLRLSRSKDFGRFAHPSLKDVPVCMLYDADTTGGNSGSPVLNSRGELIGVNFDRTYDATINDYAWSESYSRSIAVDIRYVLWIAQKFSRATALLAELGIR
jgi:hypothetical protein